MTRNEILKKTGQVGVEKASLDIKKARSAC
jgi:hypothetical protein